MITERMTTRCLNVLHIRALRKWSNSHCSQSPSPSLSTPTATSLKLLLPLCLLLVQPDVVISVTLAELPAKVSLTTRSLLHLYPPLPLLSLLSKLWLLLRALYPWISAMLRQLPTIRSWCFAGYPGFTNSALLHRSSCLSCSRIG